MPFSPDSQAFLVENHLRNDKGFFEENRDRYRKVVVEPFIELVSALAPAMLEIDEAFIAEPRIDRTISRIRRDTRFSKDKSLYRDNCWLTFGRDKKQYLGLPAFYFELNPNGYSYGMGYYMASTQSMAAVRELIVNREPSFKRALEAFEGQGVFGIFGDDYKRSRHPDQPENIRRWLDKKSFYFSNLQERPDVLYSGSLADMLKEHFALLKPVYEFILAAEGRKL